MPRTAITPQTPQQGAQLGVVSAGDLDITYTAADNANGNSVTWSSNRLMLCAWNDSAGALTITVTAVAAADSGRLTTITAYSLAADDHVHIILGRDGWQQSDGTLYLDASGSAIKFAVLLL